MTPLVSVILTVFGRIEYLDDAIRSVLSQEFESFELIVTDDANDPRVQELCRQHGDARLRYRANPSNLGTALNVRAALESSVGKYAAILNDDDSWDPQFLNHLVPVLESNPEAAVAFSDHWLTDPLGAVDPRASDDNTRKFGRDAIGEGWIADPVLFVLEQNGIPLAVSAVFVKSLIQPEDLVPEVWGAYDFWMSCLLVSSGRQAWHAPQRLAFYRVHPDAESFRLRPDQSKNIVFIFEQLLQRGLFPQHQHLLKCNLASALVQRGKHQLESGEPAGARSSFLASLKTEPRWKACLGILLSFLPRVLSRRMVPAGPGSR